MATNSKQRKISMYLHTLFWPISVQQDITIIQMAAFWLAGVEQYVQYGTKVWVTQASIYTVWYKSMSSN
jgi:hypothetical protein